MSKDERRAQKDSCGTSVADRRLGALGASCCDATKSPLITTTRDRAREVPAISAPPRTSRESLLGAPRAFGACRKSLWSVQGRRVGIPGLITSAQRRVALRPASWCKPKARGGRAMRILYVFLLLTTALVLGISFGAGADPSPVPATNVSTPQGIANGADTTGRPGAVIVSNTINNVLARRPSHGASLKPNTPAAPSTPVTINNIVPRSVESTNAIRTRPANGRLLPIDEEEVAIGAIIAFVVAVVFFLIGRIFAHAHDKASPGNPGEWLDIGCPGAFGFATLDIEVRVRGSGATWSWQPISRQKLIDVLNSMPKVRDGLLQSASARSHTAGHGGQISTVVNQTAH